jgi:hypothetical protein
LSDEDFSPQLGAPDRFVQAQSTVFTGFLWHLAASATLVYDRNHRIIR